MPLSREDEWAQTPDRRSSAAHILTAFRNLTSTGRLKPSSQTSILQPTIAPSSNSNFAEQGNATINQETQSGNEPFPTTSSPESNDAALAAIPSNVVGPPSELTKLLRQLSRSRPQPERINAALQLRLALHHNNVGSPLAIWTLGQDLLLHTSDEALMAGMTLLLGCASSRKLTSNERHIFFDSLRELSVRDNHVDLHVQILKALTCGGRNIDSVERDVLSVAAKTLKTCFDVVDGERRAKRTNGTSQEGTLNDIFRLIISVIKFNAKMLCEDQLEIVVRAVYSICQTTTAPRDVDNSIDVVVALLTFTQLPSASFRDCLELLADVYRQVKPLQSRSWDVVADIFTSHLGNQAIITYLEIVQDGGVNHKRMICRGAFRLLAHLLEKNGAYGLPQIHIATLLSAADQGLQYEDKFLAEDILRHIKELLFQSDLQALLLEEPEWETLVGCINKSADILALDTFRGPLPLTDTHNFRSESASCCEGIGQSSNQNGRRRKEIVDVAVACRNLQDIVSKLATIFNRLDVQQKDSVISLLIQLGTRLSNTAAELLITYCANEGLILPVSPSWEETCRKLVVNFLHDFSRPTYLRTLVIDVLKQAWSTIELVSADSASQLAMVILQRMAMEIDGVVLDSLADFSAAVVERADIDLFLSILTIFRITVFQRRSGPPKAVNLLPSISFPTGLPAQNYPSLCRTAVKHVIRMFIHNVNNSARKTEALFAFVLKVASSQDCSIDARICALKLLFRLRASSNHAIYIKALSESERIAAVLCRTAESATPMEHVDQVSTIDTRDVEGGSGSNASNHTTIKQRNGEARKPVPPLWFYPGPKGLPEEPTGEASIFVYSYHDSTTGMNREETVVLKVAYWLETVISLLQQPDTDWEIYSYLIVHLGAQLLNRSLFRDCVPQLRLLRNVLCDQLRASTFHEPPNHTSLKKADVAVCLFHILTILIGYHNHFARSEEDELVRTFILGMGSWDRTSKWCIHALSVCCHELPLSVSKMLDSIIQKMSQIITQQYVAVHILEFLVMLARLPDLYKNFREDEYKMVFGVSFRYLQYVREKQGRDLEKGDRLTSARQSKMQMRHSDSFRELRLLEDTDTRSKARSNSEDIPQYVYALAFHVITFWFMNLRLDDRPMYMPWIAKNLTYQSLDGKSFIEDQGLVTIDMMEKVAYTDRDETAYDEHFAKETDGEVTQRTWIVGFSLLTVATAGRTGVSQITRRRPSGTRYSVFRPSLTSPPRHHAPLTTGLAADAFYSSSFTGVLPEDIVQEFYSSYSLLDTTLPRPILLPQDDTVTRAISNFDRNSTVDGHKVGVIYIGEGQRLEAAILSNTHGSADYTAFISRLGVLTRLRNAGFNTQGLDRTEDSDGPFTYCWRDRATEIVFHITTMMPTNTDHDPQCVKKKSHIGNDFVNIVWNESGQDFQFDTFPSAFNYVYIVITPESQPSFTFSSDEAHPQDHFYKVQVLSARGFPEISPAAESKLLSVKALPDFVRLLALNASVFSLVWQNREGGEHFSPWRNRLREIKRLREKYTNSEGRSSYTNPSPATGAKVIPPSTIEKTHIGSLSGAALSSPLTGRERGGSALSHRISLATFSGSEDLCRSSITTSSTDDRVAPEFDH
ncbi:uncharacterized protein PV09_09569 [Verruconis gallopava]|uniref:Rap-GAP domain-containing protein n=1 Tax=Verruconis gallopava TaxID=253628 RepID=A0A0D1X967_9PEZI|nr:uncharacterized protein PV09_09569 [Verruconis gallopava]KIV98655.1 hypothetical protein PV09_09569 [Verruconis gallopava]